VASSTRHLGRLIAITAMTTSAEGTADTPLRFRATPPTARA
jgi:hypothetical protein